VTELARLHPDDIEAIEAIVTRAMNRARSPWMTAAEAADHMGCVLSRVRKLTMTGDLPHEHDGRRVLYHRDRLDHFIRNGGAISP
jgi:excisionase family DNA binding protein